MDEFNLFPPVFSIYHTQRYCYIHSQYLTTTNLHQKYYVTIKRSTIPIMASTISVLIFSRTIVPLSDRFTSEEVKLSVQVRRRKRG